MSVRVEQIQTSLLQPEMDSAYPLQGEFGVEVLRVAEGADGQRYGKALLFDYSGHAEIYLPAARWGGTLPSAPTQGGIAIEFQYNRQGALVPVAVPASTDAVEPRYALELLPSHRVPNPDDLRRLVHLADWLQLPVNRDFLAAVFADQAFAHAFLTLPAGARCHHSHAGGLLSHSLEVAEGVLAHCNGENPYLEDAAVLTGLLHDVGKVLLSGPAGSVVPCEYRDHAELIDVALGVSMPLLKEADDIAHWALWRVVTAYKRQRYYEVPEAKLVAALDAVSAQRDVRRNGRGGGTGRLWQQGCGGQRIWSPPDGSMKHLDW